MKQLARFARRSAFGILALAIGACGEGGSAPDAGPPPDPAPRSATIGGSIVKGPVAGARVCAYEVAGNGKGRAIACTDSRTDGSYELAVAHRGPVIVEATGGTYLDEATGLPGVALAAPLSTLGDVAAGTTTLIATPLTTLAMNTAGRSGKLSLAAFDEAAGLVRTAFGLGAEVDLARTRPEVGAGSINAYGRALVGFSRMLKSGAALPDVLAAADLSVIKSAFENCSSPGPDPTVDILSGLTTVPRPGGPNALIDIFQPTAAWRSTLPATGALGLTGCEVLENSAGHVRLSCDPTTPRAALTFLTGSAAANGSYETAPTTGALTLAGARIVVSGGELLTDPFYSVTILGPEGTVQMGLTCRLTPTAAIIPSDTSGGLILNQDVTLPVFGELPAPTSGGSISTGSPVPSLSPSPDSTPDPTTGGSVSMGTGTLSIGSGSIGTSLSSDAPGGVVLGQ